MKINRHFSSDVRTGLLPYVRQLRNMSREQLFICAMETREKQLLAQVQYSTALLYSTPLYSVVLYYTAVLLCSAIPYRVFPYLALHYCPALSHPALSCLSVLYLLHVFVYLFSLYLNLHARTHSTHTHTHKLVTSHMHVRYQELYKRNGRCEAVRYEGGAIVIDNGEPIYVTPPGILRSTNRQNRILLPLLNICC